MIDYPIEHALQRAQERYDRWQATDPAGVPAPDLNATLVGLLSLQRSGAGSPDEGTAAALAIVVNWLQEGATGSNLTSFNLLSGTNTLSFFSDNDSLETAVYYQPRSWSIDGGTTT